VTAWRICKPRYAATAFDGLGAAGHPGRWNRFGQHVVYTSDSPSLAVLEILVNAPGLLPLYSLISCAFDDSLATDIGQLPDGWQRLVDPSWAPLQALGSAWYESRRSAVLRVPSAVIPDQKNYILNVLHPDFAKITIGPPRHIETDFRLIGR